MKTLGAERNNRIKPLLAAILCASGGGLAGTEVQAQEAGDVVTLRSLSVQAAPDQPGQVASPKFTAPLLDTPQTVQVIPSELFTQQGAQSLTDVLRNTPGISFSAGENGFSTNTNNFTLRGFDTSGNIFVDGTRDSGNYRRDVFNVEQVEVVKGPAADNGRGGAGGYINIETKTPQLRDSQTASIGYGFDEYDSEHRLRTALDVNRIVGDGTAIRMNLLMQEGGVAGRQMAEHNSLGVAPSLAFGLDGPTRLVLGYQYLEQEDLPDWGIPAAFIEDMVRFDRTVDEDDRDRFYGLASDHDDTVSHSAMARIEHDFSRDFSLSNQTRWVRTDRDARYTVATAYDAATREVATQAQFYERENTSISNLTNLTFRFDTGALRHTAAAGLEISRETSDALRFGTANQPATDIANPDPFRAGVPVVAATEISEVTIDTIALYAYDTIALSERWELTGGLRGERYEVDIESRSASGNPQGPDQYDVSDTTLSGKLGLVFKPVEHGSVYGAVSMSTLPPGSYLSNPDISRTGNNAFPGLVGQNNEEARTQKAINYELGVKWNLFDDRLNASAAVFHTERRNVAITGAEEPGGDVTLQGYGKQIVQGIELSLIGEIREGWTAWGGILFLDSERKHSALLDERRRNANPADFSGDFGIFNSTNGDELAFTPDITASVWTSYAFRSGLTLGGGIQHVADSWAGRPDDADRIIPNGMFGELPGYTVLNLMASYAVSENLLVRLNIDNVTDELYAVSTNWAAQRVFTGAPRSYLLTADLRF
ncbi:MAG: TonB-dependent receptor [Gammaproteobacteria bacterium]|nr:TonB-dependent receptor [Gammaproteobacteria bacterium]